ncbi:39S ribosomal protein L37, mitochondrial-like [Dendronephthya gigantea]|uniref:39S ribosomal protein L37, mitochondrial-like n=1 Tax=Dendronephthya gigantea TaxID=151771 RepID=UPI00106A550F|nr:39S ribosomal protein L37, mitochondrial-like [Dendronephthya gigantea]
MITALLFHMNKSMLILRTLKQNSVFQHLRHGYTGPSRLRLKRKDQKDEARSKNDPYIFHPRVRTIEPIRQVLRNTKSIMSDSLPSVVLSGMDDLPFENLLPQIRHSVASSLSSDDTHNMMYLQRSKGMIMNVVKAAWSCADRYPGLLRQTLSYRPDLKVSWNRFGYLFQVSGKTGLLFSSENPLPKFSSSKEVEKTMEISVEEKDELISPVFELSQNVSGKEFDNGFYNDIFQFPRTLVIGERNWKLPHLIAQGIMFSFGRLVEHAVSKNGASFGDVLQNPLSMRSIAYNDTRMALLCYQLNTLNFDNELGIKNQLWLSPEFQIGPSKRDLNVDSLEFSDNDLKQLIAFLLYGEAEGEETLEQIKTII